MTTLRETPQGAMYSVKKSKSFGGTKYEIGDLRDEIGGGKSEFEGLQKEYEGLKREYGGLKTEFGGLKSECTARKNEGLPLTPEQGRRTPNLGSLRQFILSNIYNIYKKREILQLPFSLIYIIKTGIG